MGKKSKAKARPTCKTCRYWEPWDYGNDGECRRYPPAPVMSPAFNNGEVPGSFCPDTGRDSWCGEWKGVPEGWEMG